MLCTGISPTPEAKAGRTCSSTYPGHTAHYVVLASALPQEAKPSCSLLWWKDCALVQQGKRNALRVAQSTPSFKRRNPQDENLLRWAVPADSAVFGLFSSLLPTHSLCPRCPDLQPSWLFYETDPVILYLNAQAGFVVEEAMEWEPAGYHLSPNFTTALDAARLWSALPQLMLSGTPLNRKWEFMGYAQSWRGQVRFPLV